MLCLAGAGRLAASEDTEARGLTAEAADFSDAAEPTGETTDGRGPVAVADEAVVGFEFVEDDKGGLVVGAAAGLAGTTEARRLGAGAAFVAGVGREADMAGFPVGADPLVDFLSAGAADDMGFLEVAEAGFDAGALTALLPKRLEGTFFTVGVGGPPFALPAAITPTLGFEGVCVARLGLEGRLPSCSSRGERTPSVVSRP
ncbi:hypothetical protein BDN72DRAFT_33633 [Pluteus cervinus]|uniref:Uncharacterized protein n=1 Tax=Pluteus cervinus TaxID=181527 RepID=A0ACD3BH57_9AGAR|nr:hypothetical protein BDN72DRAFT_33633 [Pluteus cervinus]